LFLVFRVRAFSAARNDTESGRFVRRHRRAGAKRRDAAIHLTKRRMDCRVKPGNDQERIDRIPYDG
jgi:hypothetical protein